MISTKPGGPKIEKPRDRLYWAITGTNLVGMPALLIYLFAVIGIFKRGKLIVADFNLDPLFLPTTFILLVSVSLAFVIIHYFHVIKAIDSTGDYIDFDPQRPLEDKRKLARQALRASEWFPYHTCYVSMAYYIGGSPLAVLFINVPYAFSLRQNASMLAGIWITGVLISVFQYYASRRTLVEFQRLVLGDFPELLLEDQVREHAFWEVGIKTKSLFAIVVLAALMVILSSSAALNFAFRSLQIQTAEFYQQQISRRLPEIENKIDAATPPGQIELAFRDMALDPLDQFLLIDENHRSFLQHDLDRMLLRTAQLILHQGAWETWERDPLVRILSEDTYSAVVGLNSHYVVIHFPFRLRAAASADGSVASPERILDLLVLVSDERYNNAIAGMDLMVFIGLGVGLLLALYYGKLSSEDVRNPLIPLMDALKAMAAGDLTQNVLITSSDELGVVARSLARAIFGLRHLIGAVHDAVAALDQTADLIAAQSADISAGSTTQVHETDETSMAIEEMKTSVQGIADSVGTLATSTDESSASIIEVQATIEHVANNVETLSASVIETTASIQEMSASIGQVADNVQHLTHRAEEANAALNELERMIDKVSIGSQQTAALTGEVVTDAEQGALAVQLTIRGIDKIQETSKSVAEVITSLGQRAKEIGNILNVINDVTEETNLLALNAAIIAAQAGEHGRGFSVVADEIKDLAERTAASTSEIADLIQSVQDDAATAVLRTKTDLTTITEGVRLSGEAGNALREIQASVAKAITRSQEIAAAVSVQTQKSRQIMEFMDGVNALISQVAHATQEQKKSGAQIFEAAEIMKGITQQVKRATGEQTQGSRQITQSIEHISEITNFINTAQRDQLKSTDSVRIAVRRIQEVADQNQTRVTNLTQSVDALKNLSHGLQELIDEFRLQKTNS
jgi:methyl-accepting chemotaxis protein